VELEAERQAAAVEGEEAKEEEEGENYDKGRPWCWTLHLEDTATAESFREMLVYDLSPMYHGTEIRIKQDQARREGGRMCQELTKMLGGRSGAGRAAKAENGAGAGGVAKGAAPKSEASSSGWPHKNGRKRGGGPATPLRAGQERGGRRMEDEDEDWKER